LTFKEKKSASSSFFKITTVLVPSRNGTLNPVPGLVLQKNLVPVLKMGPSSSPVWVTWTGTLMAPGSSSCFSLYFFATLKIPVPVPNINGPGNVVLVPELVPKRGSGFSLVFTNSG
jgi:hypothetical protein